MLNKLLLSAVIVAAFALAASAQPVDFGAGVNFMPGGGSEVGKSTTPVKSIFVAHIAKKMNKDEAALQKLWRKGYGFLELIRISMIVDQSHETLDKIIEQRDKNVKLSVIAKKYNLDYKNIYNRSYEIKSELDAEATDYMTEPEEQVKP